MNAKLIFNIVRKSIGDNAPTILSALGAVGVVSTGVLAAKAAPEAKKEVDLDILNNGEPKTKLESAGRKIKVTWKLYAPAVIAGSCAIICIAMAQNENLKRQAALIGAYSISTEAFKDYREKAEEALGKKKSAMVNADISEQKIKDNPPSKNTVFVTSGGDTLCYDAFSGRYFRSDVESIRAAVNEFNKDLITHSYASLNDFYGKLEIPYSVVGEEMGWTVDKLLEVEFDSVLSEENQPCLALRYTVDPTRSYWKNPTW